MTSTAEKYDSLSLQTLDHNNKPPKERLPDPRVATDLVQQAIYGSQERDEMAARSQGQRDGNAPWSRKALRDAGQANRISINTMEGDALAANAVTPYYDLFNSTKNPIIPHTSYGDPMSRDVWDNIVSEELHTLIKRWRSWHIAWWQMLNDFTWHGRAVLLFKAEHDFRFECVEQDRLKFPDGTSVDPDNWECFVILQDLPVHRLWEMVSGDYVDKHWNVEATKDAIANALPKSANPTEPMELQRMFNEKAFFYEQGRIAVVMIAHIYVKEFSGKWTHKIVMQPQSGQQGESKTQDKKAWSFLYSCVDKYDDPSEFMGVFVFDVNHRNVNECTGMGKKTTALLGLNDRVFCSQFDGVFLRLGLTVQPTTADTKQKWGIMQVGALNVLPPGLTIQQATILTDIKSAFEARMDLRNILGTNTGVFRPSPEKSEGNPPTLGEFMARQQNAQVLSSSAIDRFYDQLDHFYTQFFERVNYCSTASEKSWSCKEAKHFRERCLERGVPKEYFDNIETVEAARAVGSGSTLMRQQIMGAIMQILPRLPEDGQQNVIEDFIATFAGQHKVDRWMPDAARKRLPNHDQWDAMSENADMKIGAPVTWGPWQNDIIHAQVHLQAGAEAAKGLQQGANPIEVHDFIDRIGAHVTTHLQNASKDPSRKDAVKFLGAQLKQMASLNDKLKGMIQKKAQESKQNQEAQQQLDAKTKLKAFETQAKVQLQREKTGAMMQMKREQHAQKMAIADAEAGAGIRRQLMAFQAKPQRN